MSLQKIEKENYYLAIVLER